MKIKPKSESKDVAEREARRSTESQRTVEAKWGKKVTASGWTAFPNALMNGQRQLKPTAQGMNILLHLLRYWWSAADLPRPSKATIAKAMGVHPRTIQRRIASMERSGLISRKSRNGPSRASKANAYDLAPLVKTLTHMAEQALKEKKPTSESGAAPRRPVRALRMRIQR